MAVKSPTLKGVVIEDRATVAPSERDGLGGFIGAKIDGLRGGFVGSRPESQSTATSFSPAFKGVVIEDGTGVEFPEGDGLSGFICPEVDGLGSGFVGCRSESKSTVSTFSPTL